MTASMSRIASAGIIGALLEWYDFYIFATASAIVFGQLFFPGHDPVASTMASFGAFAAGFLARPLGGLIFGHIGDRFGRKASLIGTLLIIGVGTFLIGLLPTYAEIGVWAPIALVILRVLQGIGLGGEYGGASLIAIEHAPVSQRGFWGSLIQAASPGGLLLATGAFSLVSLLPHDSFIAWGWRIPFLFSAVMLVAGLYIRLRVAETPEFEAGRGKGDQSAPLMQLLRTHKRAALLATGARLAETVAGNMIKSFGLTYVTVVLGLDQKVPLGALVATSVVGLVLTPFYGVLGDRFGAQLVYVVGAAMAALLAFPFFWVLQGRTELAVWAGFILAYNLGPTMMLSVQPTFFAQLFGPKVRYTGLSVAYQVSSIIGGFTPLAALSLMRANGGAPWIVAGLIAAIGVFSLTCSVLAGSRRQTVCVG